MEELDENSVDMRTIIFVLSPKAVERYIGGKKFWLETRGYKSEISGAQLGHESADTGQFLVLGGTTEGRAIAEELLAEGYTVTVSVVSEPGEATVPKGAGVLTGARGAEDWSRLFGDMEARSRLRGVIDATHPFAEAATAEIAKACGDSGVALCRFVRPVLVPDDAVLAVDLDDATQKAIEATSEGDLVFLAIGANNLHLTVPSLRKSGRNILARVLPTAESVRHAERAGLSPREIIAVWGVGDADYNEALCRFRGVCCIISKESGAPGGVDAKAEAARRMGITFILISRPAEFPNLTCFEAMNEILAWCGEKIHESQGW
jgi:precorrin-6x reductase